VLLTRRVRANLVPCAYGVISGLGIVLPDGQGRPRARNIHKIAASERLPTGFALVFINIPHPGISLRRRWATLTQAQPQASLATE